MSITREHILAEALTWEGTPYHHQACLKGVGVDCAMLLVGIARDVGLLPASWTPSVYSPEWHCHQKEELLVKTLRELGCVELETLEAAQPGDIVAFRISTYRTLLPVAHVGVLLPGQQLLHAVMARAVVRHHIAARWQRDLALAFAFPGVSHG